MSRQPVDAAQTARIDAVLPQTQCTRCGEADCAAYAGAVAAGAPINRCPPGGAEGVRRLAEATGRAVEPLDAACGQESPRSVAWIDEAACIGCTLCIKACPVDCIVGAAKHMHTIVEDWCTGCELCLPACPVDCIHLDIATPGASGWDAWSTAQAEQARTRYTQHNARLARADAVAKSQIAASAEAAAAQQSADAQAKQSTIAAAVARARFMRDA